MGIVENVLKKFTPAPAPVPAAATTALTTVMRNISELHRRRLVVVEKDRSAKRDVDAYDTAATEAANLRSEIDQRLADAHYSEVDPPDLRDLESKLNEAIKRLDKLGPIGRAAQIVRRRYATDIASLTREAAELNPQIQPLLHATLIEDRLPALAAEFLEAEDRLREIHYRVFAIALAADQIAMKHHFGRFVGSGLFYELNITRPDLPAFKPDTLGPEAVQAASRARGMALEDDAERLAHNILTSEAPTS